MLFRSQVQELVAAGWEIGSHSMTHQDLTKGADINYEIYQSRVHLESLLGVVANTFAYPYGAGNEFVFGKAYQYGYDAAMGLGNGITHYTWTLYYLSRIPVLYAMTIDDLARLLNPVQ